MEEIRKLSVDQLITFLVTGRCAFLVYTIRHAGSRPPCPDSRAVKIVLVQALAAKPNECTPFPMHRDAEEAERLPRPPVCLVYEVR